MKNKYPILLYVGENFDANFYYYSKVEITNAFLLLWDKKYLFVHEMDVGLTKEFKGKIIVERDLLKSVLKYIKGRCIYIDKSLPYGILRIIEKNVKIMDGTQKIRERRMKKTWQEVKYLTKAIKKTVKLLNQTELWGRTEKEIADELYSETYLRGFTPSFEPVVATKKNAGVPHHNPDKTKIKDMVLIDYGLKYRHYHADITRCFFEKNEKKRPSFKMYEKIKDIAHEIVDEMPNLETAKDLAEFSEKLFKKRKVKKLIHLIGHGIGLDIHEKPLLSKASLDKLEGTTLAIEPGYYSKIYGVRFELDIYVNKGKAIILEDI